MGSLISSQFHHTILNWWRHSGRILPWRERKEMSDVICHKSKFYQLPNSKTQSRDKSIKYGELSIEDREKDNLQRERAFQSYFAGEKGRDPYRVVVAELMLQQTQVDRVLPKYQAWMTKWPSIQDFTKASLAEVLIEWKGLGYNRRAKFLWELARVIVEKYHGEWPQTEKELLKLPGIGQYTARAVLSFSFDRQVAVVDTNVKRVIQRWFGLLIDKTLMRGPEYSGSHSKNSNSNLTFQDDASVVLLTDKNISEKQWFSLADSLLPLQQADPWNQALMDFGALICTARQPQCTLCPVAKFCRVNQLAMQQGFTNYSEYLVSLPVKQKIKKGKDAGKKFEETDRYARGRIIDILREKRVSGQELLTELATRFRLQNPEQIREAIQQLMKEEMVKEETGKLGLP